MGTQSTWGVAIYQLVGRCERLDPWISQDVLYPDTSLGVGVEHALDDCATFAWDEVGQRRRRRRGRVGLDVWLEGWVRHLGDAPRKLLKVHAVEDDGRRPDVNQASIVLCDERSGQRRGAHSKHVGD